MELNPVREIAVLIRERARIGSHELGDSDVPQRGRFCVERLEACEDQEPSQDSQDSVAARRLLLLIGFHLCLSPERI
jgi:hypothetical protein